VKLRRILGIAALTCAALAGLAYAYLRATLAALPQVEVGDADSCTPMQPAGPARTAWAGPVLEVRLDATGNCAAGRSDFTVQRLGGTLFVRAITPEPLVATGCWCTRTYTLRLGGLPPGDYRIHQYAWP
jgi:hypothetical protein